MALPSLSRLRLGEDTGAWPGLPGEHGVQMLSLVEKQRLDSATTLDEVCRLLYGEDPVRTVDWDMKLGVREAVSDRAYMEALAERVMRADLGLLPSEGLHRVHIGIGEERFWEPVDTGFASWLDLLREGCRQLRPMTRFEPVAGMAQRILFRIFVRRSRAVVLMLLRNANSSRWLGGAASRLKADPEVVLAAVRQDGMALRHASQNLQNDPDVVLAAVQQDGMALQHASRELQHNDRDLVLAAVQQNGDVLYDVAEAFLDDAEVVIEAIFSNPDAWSLASQRLLEEDRDVALAAVGRLGGGHVLQFLVHWQDDRGVVLAAVRSDGLALEFASARLRADREVVFAAVRRDGMALQFVNYIFRDDDELVSMAVHQDGMSLQYGFRRFRADRELVLAAVRRDGLALEFASEGLQADREVVLAAVGQNDDAVRWASYELQRDPEVQRVQRETYRRWATQYDEQGSEEEDSDE